MSYPETHVCVSIYEVSHSIVSSTYTHVAPKPCLHGLHKMWFSQWPVQGFFFTYHCDKK